MMLHTKHQTFSDKIFKVSPYISIGKTGHAPCDHVFQPMKIILTTLVEGLPKKIYFHFD